ncbi:(Fe-S)-binding protein [Gleimia sp. 6138-11-ORH1]|uniref:(Fe-S)-binding protein n=1 Tax=Gleimia sp. 6138-11-ORH1 TaxID=2973937 RepID=UPI002169B122|nr:(Fe-S)-binding protein [Gleimia sp. 6138-11-ORH1]MCS4484708.1 (Fe-S)-binding protein [Gleimia sp. 6138-11-ORH1]
MELVYCLFWEFWLDPTTVRLISLFLALIFTGIGLYAFSRAIFILVSRVKQGKPQPGRFSQPGARLKMLLVNLLSHREFKGRPGVRVAHWLVMLSFPILFLTLLTGYGQLFNPAFQLPLAHFYPFEWLIEVFAWGSLLGIFWLVFVRVRAGAGSLAEAEGGRQRVTSGVEPNRGKGSVASRFLGSTRWEAVFVEAIIALVVVAVIGLRAIEYALAKLNVADEFGQVLFASQYATYWHFPLTGWLGDLLVGVPVNGLLSGLYVLALVKIFVSMSWMTVVGVVTTMGVAWHRFLAVVNVYARRYPSGVKSLGALPPLLVEGVAVRTDEDLESLSDDAVLGYGSAADLTWKARLDFSTCTECGRCQELCPAWNTGKPLSPKLLMLALRDHVAAVETTGALPAPEEGSNLVEVDWPQSAHSFDLLQVLQASGNTSEAGVSLVESALVGEVISEDALWDCTTCGACVDQCPVDIEHVDHIINLRRHQVLMESAFPRDLAKPFRSLETKGNPYGQAARKRLDWAKNLEFPVPVIGEDVADASEVDWVFWVGCAGAFDDKAKKTTAAIAELLWRAQVRFGVLGSAESCTGDPARRAGNELLFQMLAEQAISTLQDAAVKRIVVSCAHCFNTIANEYPELGGTFEVIHHTQLLNRLVREGHLRLAPPAPEDAVKVTFHDPCYLGRHNQVFSPPRELLAANAGLDLVEMPRTKERALCCGAGGARAWMEETRGERIAQVRVDEAVQTGATVVATGCPFCTQMLSSTSAPVEVKDVSLLMLEAVRRAAENSGD